MANDKFWKVIKRFNFLMKSAIEGPNCLDVCNGDCCSIEINVPKVLAKEYIKRSYAKNKDFIRSDVFSFKLRFDEKTGKCFLFDKKIRGCSVHSSEIKPPQCWIYPTDFNSSSDKDISCKKANGWRIMDFEKTRKAEKLLKYYIFLCQLEAKQEVKAIKNRLKNSSSRKNLKLLLKHIPPKELAGFKDSWDSIAILPAEGLSLQMKKFCRQFNLDCDTDYLECKSICDKVIEGLLNFLQQILFMYVQKMGPDNDGKYSFLKLTEFAKK